MERSEIKTASVWMLFLFIHNIMPQIDVLLERGRETKFTSGAVLESNGEDCGAYFYKNGSYELIFSNWEDGYDTISRSVYLNALTYFGSEKMGIAVWSMLEEFMHHRDPGYMISDELAAKYGLKILDKGTVILFLPDLISGFPFPVQADSVDGLKITDGKQTWTIDYPLPGSIAYFRVYIPAK